MRPAQVPIELCGEAWLEAKPRIVAIFNTNAEVLELVRESLQQAGFQAVMAHIDDLKRGRLDMIQFVEEHNPDVMSTTSLRRTIPTGPSCG
ncbi:MAG: hypothetical protein AUH83_15160 [Deltaproteobacteria bacterium 13_1_40CM_4_68_19]|nr:MAG: hypothetical protein AUH83_15160 [Deltaproteobacteria bacterium 13_1_40CM_4_68_19]